MIYDIVVIFLKFFLDVFLLVASIIGPPACIENDNIIIGKAFAKFKKLSGKNFIL